MTQIDKKNGVCLYNDELHSYWVDGNENDKFVSVTTLIGKFHEKFDENFWSRYKAFEALAHPEAFKMEKKVLLSSKKWNNTILERYNINELEFNTKVNEILDGYETERKISCERGTKFHLEQEQKFYTKEIHELPNLGLSGQFKCIPNYYDLNVDKGIFPEYLVYKISKDGILKIAGQIDLLIKDGDDFYIIDYKGLPLDTPIATNNGWSTMGELKVGDVVFDKDGKYTSIINKSSIHNNPCYEIKFDNNESIICDCDHKWVVSFYNDSKWEDKIMTAEEIKKSLELKESPKIINAKPLDIPELKTKEDISTSDLILTSSYEQRFSLLESILDSSGIYSNDKKEFKITTKLEQYAKDTCKLIASLGWKPKLIKNSEWDIYFKNSNCLDLNSTFRSITSVERVDTVPTVCIEVDSPTHTYLAGYTLIPTHNTNKEIKQKSYFDQSAKSNKMMFYPINNIQDCNYNHYTLQLSTYAWMIEQIDPKFKIKGLVIIHNDHNGKTTTYNVDYRKDDVIKMLAYHKKQKSIEIEKNKNKPITF